MRTDLIVLVIAIRYLMVSMRKIADSVANSQDVTDAIFREERRNVERMRLGVPVLDRLTLTCEVIEREFNNNYLYLWMWRVFRPRNIV